MIKSIVAAALLAALPATAQPSQRAPRHPVTDTDAKDLHDYELTPAKLDKLMALGQKVRAYAEKHPEVKEHDELMRGKTFRESIKAIEAKPEFNSMIKSEGLTARDFVLGTMSLVAAGMWASMSKQYPNAQMPEEVNPKNVKLLQDHPEILQKWQAAWGDRGRGKHAPEAEPAADEDDDKDQ